MGIQNWYVIKTAVHSEKKVYERLVEAGFEAYLPLVNTIKIWSDRKKKVAVPLIASTLFVRTSPEDLRNVYPHQGVSSVLTYLGKPAIVKDFEINNLRILLEEDSLNNLNTTTKLTKGETVQVIRGPFQGLIGTAVQTNDRFRLVIELQSLGTGFVMNIPKSFVRKYKITDSEEKG